MAVLKIHLHRIRDAIVASHPDRETDPPSTEPLDLIELDPEETVS
jgi:hypothetical protein